MLSPAIVVLYVVAACVRGVRRLTRLYAFASLSSTWHDLHSLAVCTATPPTSNGVPTIVELLSQSYIEELVARDLRQQAHQSDHTTTL